MKLSDYNRKHLVLRCVNYQWKVLVVTHLNSLKIFREFDDESHLSTLHSGRCLQILEALPPCDASMDSLALFAVKALHWCWRNSKRSVDDPVDALCDLWCTLPLPAIWLKRTHGCTGNFADSLKRLVEARDATRTADSSHLLKQQSASHLVFDIC